MGTRRARIDDTTSRDLYSDAAKGETLESIAEANDVHVSTATRYLAHKPSIWKDPLHRRRVELAVEGLASGLHVLEVSTRYGLNVSLVAKVEKARELEAKLQDRETRTREREARDEHRRRATEAREALRQRNAEKRAQRTERDRRIKEAYEGGEPLAAIALREGLASGARIVSIALKLGAKPRRKGES